MKFCTNCGKQIDENAIFDELTSIALRFAQSANASSPIVTTVEGISIDFKPLFLKQSVPIFVILSGI